MVKVRRLARIALAAALVVMKSQLVLAASVLDSFDTLDGWTAIGTDGAQVELAQDTGTNGRALRIDYRLPAAAATCWCASRSGSTCRPTTPSRCRCAAPAPPVDFEFKLIDKTDKQRLVVPRARRHAARDVARAAHQEAPHRVRLGPAERRRAAGHRRHRVRRHRHRRRQRLAVARRAGTADARRADAHAGTDARHRLHLGPGRDTRPGSRSRPVHALAQRRARARAVAEARLRPAARVRRPRHRLGSGRLRGHLRGADLGRRRPLDAGVSQHPRERRSRLRLSARRRVDATSGSRSRRATAATATASAASASCRSSSPRRPTCSSPTWRTRRRPARTRSTSAACSRTGPCSASTATPRTRR